jgi:hypothetical protein
MSRFDWGLVLRGLTTCNAADVAIPALTSDDRAALARREFATLWHASTRRAVEDRPLLGVPLETEKATEMQSGHKWAAGACFLAILYLVWPYYTLLELATAARSRDSATISERVDWERLRSSFKAQLRAQIRPFGLDMPTKRTEPFELLGGVLGLAIGDTLIDSVIDRTITPQGLANLLKEEGRTTAAAPANATVGNQPNLFDRAKFAFFVSPIHFRLDLRNPDHPDQVDSIMLMFKGTGWQVISLDLAQMREASQRTDNGQPPTAPPAAHTPPGTIVRDKDAL